MVIEGVDDEDRSASEGMTGREKDRGDEQEAEEEEELGNRKTIRKHDPRQPSEQERRFAEERPRRNGTFPKSTWTTCSWVTRKREARCS